MEYTEQEFEEAKAYLLDRLRNERSMAADVERLLVLNAQELLALLYGEYSDDHIERLLNELIDELMWDVETLAVDEHDRRSDLLLYLHSERDGETLDSRVRERVNTYYNEVYAVWLASKLLGKARSMILPSIKENLADPWNNPILAEAREMQQRGELDKDLPFEEPHFGKGVPISSLTALDRMLRYAVADTWMYWQYEDAMTNGARGYYVVRGSSYPCEECDSHTGIFYPIGDDENRPQYHLNCCCVVIYSYVDRL